jgi:hypothetical protein
MREIRTSGLMSGIWKRNGLTAPRQISTLPQKLKRRAQCGLAPKALKQTLRVCLRARFEMIESTQPVFKPLSPKTEQLQNFY